MPNSSTLLSPRRRQWVVFGLATLLPLLFGLYTNSIWEDFFITYRCSKNLAGGFGFGYNPGERLHTYTSPLGTLIPALFCYLTGNRSDMLVLWMFRVLSALCLGAAVWLTLRTTEALELQPWWLPVLIVAFDAKTVEFTSDGMETGIQILMMALSVYCLVGLPARWWGLGLAWGGLMWTRPDGFVYAIAMAVPYLAFRLADARNLLRAALLAVLVYAPWFLWAHAYYGTAIPNTVTAKSMDALPLTRWLIGFFREWGSPKSALGMIFSPAYIDPDYYFSFPFNWLPHVLGLGTALYWLLPGRAAGRAFSMAFFMAAFYVGYTGRWPWYFPSCTYLGAYALGFIFDRLRQTRKDRAMLAVAVAVWLVALQLGLLLAVARQMQVQQSIVEEKVRKQVGLWLRENARPTDTVGLECLGYFGYYSGLRTYDWPGLSSREVVEARRTPPGTFGSVMKKLKPDWLVLRPSWVVSLNQDVPGFLDSTYYAAGSFDAWNEVLHVPYVFGRTSLLFDSQFIIYHRKPVEGTPTPAEEKPNPSSRSQGDTR